MTVPPSFVVLPDRDRRLLHISLRGFWTDAVMANYMTEVRGAMRDLQQGGGCRGILIDMIDFAIQPKTIAEGHAENLRRVRAAGNTKVALVMQSALSKLQASRVAAETGHETFSSEEDALAWLLADN